MFITAVSYLSNWLLVRYATNGAGCGWNVKRQGTSGVASKRRRGRPGREIGVWTVAMETDVIARPFE